MPLWASGLSFLGFKILNLSSSRFSGLRKLAQYWLSFRVYGFERFCQNLAKMHPFLTTFSRVLVEFQLSGVFSSSGFGNL